jgi:hypothetical protein
MAYFDNLETFNTWHSKVEIWVFTTVSTMHVNYDHITNDNWQNT